VLRIARFLRIDPKLNHVVPWSLYTFPENFVQIGPTVFHNLANKETKTETKIHTNKQTNKEIDRKQYPVPRRIGDGVLISV